MDTSLRPGILPRKGVRPLEEMRDGSRHLGRILWLLFTVILPATSAFSQYSVYERITGTVSPGADTSAGVDGSKSRFLHARLFARRDDLLATFEQDGEARFARGSYGVAVDWRSSRNLRWYVEASRVSETVALCYFDSTRTFHNLHNVTRFKLGNLTSIDGLPIAILSHVQIEKQGNSTQLGYGLGVTGTFNRFSATLESAKRNWTPTYHVVFDDVYDVEFYLPTSGNLVEVTGSLAGRFGKFRVESYGRIGSLSSSNREEFDFAFKPTADVSTIRVMVNNRLSAITDIRLHAMLDRMRGNGVMRYLGRKFGNLHLHALDFTELGISAHWRLKKKHVDTGLAWQRLSARANATVEAWPFDDASIDFFNARQSASGSGRMSLVRGWIRWPVTFGSRLRINLLGEYIKSSIEAEARSRGSALIFGQSGTNRKDFANDGNFLRVEIAPQLTLTKRLRVDMSLSQWIPFRTKSDFSLNNARGGTFGQIVVAYSLEY